MGTAFTSSRGCFRNYLCKSKKDTTKNVVVAAENKSSNSVRQQGTISDEKAIKIATEAMKSYIGKDSSYFSSTKIYRSSDQRKKAEEH